MTGNVGMRCGAEGESGDTAT